MQAPIGRVGKILAGDEKGSFVKVADDGPSTGGFLILRWDDAALDSGYDHWVEDHPTLLAYFLEVRWKVEWL